MHMVVTSRHYTGRPLTGALRIEGSQIGYPLVYGIPRLTIESAQRYARWLEPLGLEPPSNGHMQSSSTVDSFGFEWIWDQQARTLDDLRWRVLDRFGLSTVDFTQQFVLDAGCGAGDQSRWMLDRANVARLISLDLSDAISITYQKLESNSNWLGVQADLAALPFAAPVFSIVYCEGVIQHTADSPRAVRELIRVLQRDGLLIATHYGLPTSWRGQAVHCLRAGLRRRMSHLDRYTILFLSGCIAALAHVPILGRFWGRTAAVTNPRMQNFKATWSCTYDSYGYHSYQRHVSAAEFASYILNANSEMEIVWHNGCQLLAKRRRTESETSATSPVINQEPR